MSLPPPPPDPDPPTLGLPDQIYVLTAGNDKNFVVGTNRPDLIWEVSLYSRKPRELITTVPTTVGNPIATIVIPSGLGMYSVEVNIQGGQGYDLPPFSYDFVAEPSS